VLARVPQPVRRWLHAGGSRQDRLRDPDSVVAALGLRPGDRVADLGPGYGHFTLRLARAVEPDGVVYAADIDPAGLSELREAAERRGISTLRTVRIGRDRLELPEPVDLLFVSATYHHLRDRVAYFRGARPMLGPGGRVAILESRAEGLLARWVAHHGTDSRRLRDELAAAGYRLVATHDLVRGHWFGVFEPALVPGGDRG
jgi:ubiquinone/menaquinone biosynthesis C-methylase UbiE